MAAEQLTLIWSSEIIRDPAGGVRIVSKEPLSHMSVRQAAKVLGCSTWQICELYQMDFLCGYKPGAKSIRSDGKASNARLRLDTESVLRYKAQQEERARWEKRELLG